jgi:hypothetical protein
VLSIEPIFLLVENDNGYTLTETEGEMYFCNARCLCILAVQLATRPNLTDDRKLWLDMKTTRKSARTRAWKTAPIGS